jgi:hemolysin activation/secretion protein
MNNLMTYKRMCLLILVLIQPVLPARAAPEKNIFDVMEYRVEGNTVLPLGKIEEAVYPHLGEAKSIDDVELARTALEKAYHEAGYLTVLVNIPEQEVDEGFVKLAVVEGSVEKLRVVDAKFNSLAALKERVPEFSEGKIPNFTEVQKQIAAVNGTQDRRVAPVLRPGKSPGKVEVDLKVQDKLPLHGGLELNNRYSANTTETRLSGSLRYDNLWQKDHSLGLSFQVTPEKLDETKVLSATYLIPRNGDFLALYGVISRSDISAIGDVNVIGNGDIVGLRYIHPLPAVDNFTHSMTLGVDYKDFKESTIALGSDSFNTPISYLPFMLGYDATYDDGAGGSTQLNLGLNFSLRGLADGNVECLPDVFLNEFDCKRFGAQPNFAYLRADLKHTQNVYKGWKVYASVGGQLSDQPLISSEQYALGGLDSGRGYLESTALGDSGINVTLELRTPPLQKYLSDKIGDLHGLAFFDAGHVSVKDALASQTDTFNLASVGLGLHLKGWNGFFGEMEFAKALRAAGQVEDGDTRVHFRMGYDW